MRLLFLCLFCAFFIITGCVNKKEHETTPIRLNTPEGLVACQLYALDLIMWDTSITRPKSMSKETADKICIAEGARYSVKLRSVLAKTQSRGRLKKFKSRVDFFVCRRKAAPSGVASGFRKTVAI
ncbi:hypothetical protein OAO92_02220 [Paracoccaceae bacterium]|nr:hypothetical protein [Paracoccaceae bacterium]MDC0582274.1 hypothetical protein [Paracoccaceae bacterium]